MVGFNCISSNSQYRLVEALASTLHARPISDPSRPELVLVQSRGIQRWMLMRLAERLGVAANIRFLFPHDLLNVVFTETLPHFDPSALLDRDRLLWEIFQTFREGLVPELKEIAEYVGEDDNHKRYQLSKQLASLFDQYSLYRPDWLSRWEAESGEGHWQAHLWRSLRESYPFRSVFQCFCEFRTRVNSLESLGSLERLSIFGISYLPPLHVELLHHLSRKMEVNLYLFNPSNEYWFDLKERREISRIRRDQRSSETRLHLEEGNRLLASNGRIGAQFLQLLLENDVDIDNDSELFERRRSPVSLLERVRHEILTLSNPANDSLIDRSDRSIQIHSCHSPMREVEVLFDQLLRVMDDHPDISCDDIVVMCPDIDEYAAVITAVFQTETDNHLKLPFSIADSGMSHGSPFIRFFFNLLELPTCRFSVPDVMAFLDFEAIRSQFGLSENDVERVTTWIQQAGVRWGIDESFRSQWRTPPVYETTWKSGIDRLMVGLAMPLHEEAFFELDDKPGILPFDDIEGNEALILGRFLEFFNRLTRLVSNEPPSLRSVLSLGDWCVYFREIARTFFLLPEDQRDDLNVLLEVLDELETIESSTRFTAPVESRVVYDVIRSKLDERKSGWGFLGSGITFCSMLPMRSIPFDVIAIIGLNESVFPRIAQPKSFDLMKDSPRLGDRSFKLEDRYIFLEALLSARRIFYLSYVGQSVKTNDPIPPSILVSELRNYIEDGYGKKNPGILDRIQTRHPLQPYNPIYYEGGESDLFSYDSSNLEAARRIGREKRPPAPFLRKLPSPDSIEIDHIGFSRFFFNPSKYLMTERLGIVLEEYPEIPAERESFQPDSLSRYLLREELLEADGDSTALEHIKKKFKARGQLPLSAPGDLYFEDTVVEVEGFKSLLSPRLEGKTRETIEYDFELGEICFKGQLTFWSGNLLVHVKPTRLNARDRIYLWVTHLIAEIVSGKPFESLLLMYSARTAEPTSLRCEPLKNPTAHLETLTRYFQLGQLSPLAFFPVAATRYLEELEKKGEAQARNLAEKVWSGDGDRIVGEVNTPYIQYCFGHLSLFETDFTTVANDILDPILTHQTKPQS